MGLKTAFLSLLTFVPLIAAAPGLSSPSLSKRCVNSPDARNCWGDFDISTNYYDEVPDTGVTREYWFNIVNTTAAPDGVERIVLAVNGTIPGPTIIADWGDTVVVHVTNSMQDNGTSIHFHGIRQNYTNQNDGVAAITQCPTAPGQTTTYRWRATQYGSSWWHSHFYVQAWDGVFGGIIINGPATANYDVDLGSMILADWSHDTADNLALVSRVTGPPSMDTGLINGTNTFTQDDGTVVGARHETVFTAGTRYRIRLVNVAADTHFKFTIDNHTMEVIASDFVAVNPYSTDVVNIAIGQRYDIIVTANATADNYWLRAIAQTSCSNNDNPGDIKGIVRYDSTSTADPTSQANDNAAIDECIDETSLVPYVKVDASDLADVSTDFSVAVAASAGRFYWSMGNTTFINQWNYPSLLQVNENNNTWSAEQNMYQLPNANEWVYWIVQTSLGAAHPLHLHGHDFWVLGQGVGTYDAATADLQTVNVPRRDVVLLPASGWVAFAFITDNPGVWLTHCHIAWHTSEGLAVQMVERQSEIAGLTDSAELNDTCDAWNAYATSAGLVQDDSGL
ncbi:putative multicopper oxidase [Diaporthe ampelina]|uniref:Putative multicopper oxidase n=1 Tax=Diaporthe ampelina TaxID=1214573 RepID=A0A0G2H3W7_9PEZI|nr:putative multicopper oxidase [Diaporthe ampelina]